MRGTLVAWFLTNYNCGSKNDACLKRRTEGDYTDINTREFLTLSW